MQPFTAQCYVNKKTFALRSQISFPVKSADDPKTAMILVKDVLNMCNSRGFHLIKFISNNKELLMSISEDQRRNGVKNADLISDFSTGKALGIQWNIPEDSFTSNIHVN